MEITEDFMAKKAAPSARAKRAAPAAKTSGRTSKSLAKTIATRKPKKVAHRPARSPIKPLGVAPKVDPDVIAAQASAHSRESWKEQEHHLSDVLKAQHQPMMDERAHARATDGQHFANRKAR